MTDTATDRHRVAVDVRTAASRRPSRSSTRTRGGCSVASSRSVRWPTSARSSTVRSIDYDEHFLPGCTTRMRHNIETFGAHFLQLQLGHEEPGVDRHLGYGLSLSERDDGAYGEFQLYTKRRDYGLVREMLGTAWKGLSVSFRDRVPPVVDDRGRGCGSVGCRSTSSTSPPCRCRRIRRPVSCRSVAKGWCPTPAPHTWTPL